MAQQRTTCATAVIGVLVAVFVVIPSMARAQEPAKAFDLLSSRLKPGDTIWVTDANEREINGTIGAGVAATAGLMTEARRPFDSASLARAVGAELRLQGAMRNQGSAFTRQKRDSVWDGVAIGAGVGALAGGVLAASTGECDSKPDYGGGCGMVGAASAGQAFVFGAMAGAVVGAGVGLIVDLLIK